MTASVMKGLKNSLTSVPGYDFMWNNQGINSFYAIAIFLYPQAISGNL